jgi:hypothetical protein
MERANTTTRSWPAFLEVVRIAEPVLPAFDFVADLADELIGSKLTTATVFDMGARRLRRVYSQNPEAYAVGGFKPIPDNKWTDTLLVRQQIYTALSIEEIAEDFFDWQLIRSLGCGSILNIPVVVGGQVIGALNLLHEAGYYTSQRLARADEVLPFATVAFLLEKQVQA